MGSQLLQNTEINIVMHWKFWRKYGPVSHLFSCKGQEISKGNSGFFNISIFKWLYFFDSTTL